MLQSLEALERHTPESEEYGKMLDQTIKLHKLRSDTPSRSVSPDTLVLCATNLIGILLVTRFERTGIVTSKALGIALKPR